MEIITSEYELAAVGGGARSADRIQCMVSSRGFSCTGSLSDFVGALNDFGSWLGGAVYDALH